MVWKGDLTVEAYSARWFGAIGNSRQHRHFAAQAILSKEPLRLISGNKETEGTCFIIEPNAEHRHTGSLHVEMHFLEPGGTLKDHDNLRRRLIQAPAVLVSDDQAIPFWTNWLFGSANKRLDGRVAHALADFDALIAEGPVHLSDFVRTSGLSEGRFRHLFAREMGIPFKRYVLWRRIRMASRVLATGASATHAAHSAGFADSAHFSRTLKAMFGISPTFLLQHNR